MPSAYPFITNVWLSQLILPVDSHQLCLKDERRPCWNRPHSSISIAKFRRYRELPLLADAHVKQAFVPAEHSSSVAPSVEHKRLGGVFR
jgi:hypothetical protein